MKLRFVWGYALVAVLWAAAAAAQAPDLSNQDIVLRAVPDGPVASVNGQTVSAQAFIEQYRRDLEQVEARLGKADDATRVQLGLQTLGRLIEDIVLLDEAGRRKLEVPAAELDEAWQKELKILEEQTKKEGQPLSSEAELLKRAGTTRDAARAELRRAMLVERMRDRIAEEKGVKVSDAEVDKFVKDNAARFDSSARYRVRHILIRPASTRGKITEQEKAKARQRAEDALTRIRSGLSFEAVAKEVSEGPRREQGGDMGLLTLAEMGPVISAAVQEMKPGEVSGIVESEYGYHIIQLVETTEGGQLDMTKVKSGVRQAMMTDKAEGAVKDFVKAATEENGSLRVYLRLDRQLANRPDLQQRLSPAPGK